MHICDEQAASPLPKKDMAGSPTWASGPNSSMEQRLCRQRITRSGATGALDLCHSRAWLPREESRILGLVLLTPGSNPANSGLIDSISFCFRVMRLILLAGDRLVNVTEVLVLHQPVHPVSARERAGLAFLVLADAAVTPV